MAQKDQWGPRSPELSDPGQGIYEVTPHNANELPIRPKCLYIAVGGDICIDDMNGDPMIVAVPSAFYLLVRVKKVWENGTTAEGIYAII